jgi:FeS assembly SUF system protein
MENVPRKLSLTQPAEEDHAAKVMREKIGDVRSIAAGSAGTAIEAGPEQAELQQKVVAALHTIFDPEIPVNIFDLGLIYRLVLDATNAVKVEMTLTAPGCPVAGDIVAEVRRKIEAIPEVPRAEVELVWDPPWTRERLSEDARLELGM